MNKYNVSADSSESTVTVDGIEYRYRVVDDQDHSVFDDGDWYGELDMSVTHSWNTRPDRPGHFDGNSELLSFGRSNDRVWWQPTTEVKRGTDEFRSLRSSLLELLEYGYVGVIVETDQDSESLWGIGAMDTECINDTVCELIDEIRSRIAGTSDDVTRWVNVGLAV